jgi:hypothetical protein
VETFDKRANEQPPSNRERTVMRKAFSGLLIVCALAVVSSNAQPRTSRILELGEL